MKRIMTLLFALTIIVSAAFANEDPKLSTSQSAVSRNGKHVKLYYKAPSVSDVKVKIRNAAGTIVYSEVIPKSGGFIRPYDFSGQEDGTYTIEIRDSFGSQFQRVAVNANKAELIARLVKINCTENKVMLAVPNKNTTTLTVQIYNSRGELIHENTEKVTGDYAKVFNLGDQEGDFTLQVTDTSGLSKIIEF